MAYKLSGGAGGDINTERKGRGGRRKPTRPKPAPAPRNRGPQGLPGPRKAVITPSTRRARAKTTPGAFRSGVKVRRSAPAKPQPVNKAFVRKRARQAVAARRGRIAAAKDRERKANLPRYDKIDPDTRHAFPYASQNTVAQAKYKAYAERLWPKVRRHYGLPKGTPMPGLKVIPGSDKTLLAMVPRSKGGRPERVLVTSGTALANSRKTNRKDRKARDYARGVLIHEWAHVRQKDKNKKSRVLVEGSAEAFEREIRKKLGLRQSTNSEYREFVKHARTWGGRKYILDRQFKGDR